MKISTAIDLIAYCGCRSEGQSNETRLRLIRDEPSSHIFTVVSTSCLSSLFHPSHSTLHSLDIMYPRQRTSLANCTTSREIIPLTNAIFVNRCFIIGGEQQSHQLRIPLYFQSRPVKWTRRSTGVASITDSARAPMDVDLSSGTRPKRSARTH